MNPDAKSRPYRCRLLHLLLLVGACIAAFWPSVRTLGEIAWSHEQYSHILLVFPISLGFAFAEGRTTTEAQPAGTWWGLALFVPALILGWIGIRHGVLPSESV